MASIDGVVAQLRQVVNHLHQAVARTRAARDMTEEMRDRADALGARGLARQFAGNADTTERLLAMLVAAIDAGERLIAQAEAIRHGGAAAGGTVPTSVPVASAPAGPRPEAGFRRSVAERVRPRRTQQTFGIATDTDGNPLHEGELASGHPRHSPVDPTAGIRDPRTRGLTAVSMHVEGRVAALMRRPGAPQDVVLYLNNQVCRGRDGGRGCFEVLPGILPAGSRLTVHTVEGGRRIRTEVFEGIGSEL